MTKNQRDAAKAVEALRGEMIDLADALHAHPEMALEEHESSRRCAETLQAHGFDVTRPFRQMPTAFLATRGRGKPVIGMLAEYDALPNCGLDGGPGHGCGHNLLGPAAIAGAIAAADVLAKRKARGTIALFGCPAEETLVGKCYMARDGAFDGLDACLSWHPSDMTCADHESWAANDSMTFEFFGVSAHAAGSPHEGRSALDAVEIMNVAVNFLREHVEENVRIHYCILDGGAMPNVVPGYAKSWYMIRGKDRAQVGAVRARVVDCARGAALATGTRLKTRVLAASYNHLVNAAMTGVVEDAVRAFGPPRPTAADLRHLKSLGLKPEIASSIDRPDALLNRASTDEANISWITPLGRFRVACYARGSRVHSDEITRQMGAPTAHRGMLLAGKVFAAAAVTLVENRKRLNAAKAEFRKQTKGFTYDPIVPKRQAPPGRDQISMA